MSWSGELSSIYSFILSIQLKIGVESLSYMSGPDGGIQRKSFLLLLF